MNALLRRSPISVNPQALALVVLAIHGTVVLLHQSVYWWQLCLVVIMLALGISHLLKKPYIPVSLELEFFVALGITLVLMSSTGGTGSLFLAWLFVLALYYPLQMNEPLGKWIAPSIGLAYLFLLPFSPSGVPLAIVIARSLLITTIGWSVYDLGKKLKQATQTQEKTVEALRSSEHYLRNLVETIPGITYIGARDGTMFMSPQIKTLLGYEPRAFVEDKRFWKKCIHPDDLEAVLFQMHRTYAPNEDFACEYRMIANDGRVLWFRDEAKIQRDAEGYIQELQGIMLDITERKNAEAQLSYQASLVDNLFDAVVSTDREFRVVSMNKAAEQLYGYTEHEAIGKTVQEILRNEYPTTTREKVIQEFATTGSWVGEVIQTNRAGESLPILGSVSRVLGKDGNYLGAVAINKDMREMKKAQLALQESESRYRNLLEQAAEGIFVSDHNLQLVLVNEAICELLGYTKEELLTMKVPDLIDQENLEQLPLQNKAVQSGNVIKTERLLRRKDGSSVLVEGSAKLLPDGTIQTILHDISERKRAEEALKRTEAFYRGITEKSSEGIAVLSRDSNVRYISASGTAMIGFTEGDILGQNRTDLVHPDDAETFTRTYSELRPEESVTLEYRIKKKDGDYFWNESRFTNLLDNPAVNGYVVNYRDISERKHAEEALKQTEAFYRAITEKSNEGVFIFDRDRVIRYRNASGMAIMGFTDEELLGRERLDLIHPHDVERVLHAYSQLRPNESVTLEYRLKRKDGDWFWNESLITNLLDNPAVNGYVVNYRDISERKGAEEKLQQTEAFYRAITEKSYEGITVIDKASKVLYRSTANITMSGYQNEELTEENVAQFTHPEDRERIIETIQKLSPNESRLIEFRFKLAQGEWRWLEARLTNLLDLPAVNGYVINTRDISDRKHAEEHIKQAEAFYRAITEKSDEGIMVFDKDLIIKYRSPSQLHVTAFPYDDMVGRNRTDLIHPDDLKEFLQALPQLKPGQTLLNTFRMQNKDGAWDWFESRVTNLLEHPAVGGYVSNYYTINERKRAEDAQRELSRRLLTVQEEERRSLARELHDEIGQSLTAIKVSLQTAQRLQTPETINNALSITDQILSQVRELSLNLHPRLLEDLGLIAAVRWYAIQQGERNDLEVELKLEVEEAKIPAELKISMYRIVQEGLTNIIRHSRARHVCISLTEQVNEILLSIEDDGVGFEPTRQVKSSLGLISMRERTELHGGHLELRSGVGQGTDVLVTFPSKRVSSEAIEFTSM